QFSTWNVPAYPTSVTGISGTVFLDSNADGITNPGDPGLAGVGVSLLTASGGAGADPARPTLPPPTTDGQGAYSLPNLLQGAYNLVFQAPAGYIMDGSHLTTWTQAIVLSSLTGLVNANAAPAAPPITGPTVIPHRSTYSYTVTTAAGAIANVA